MMYGIICFATLFSFVGTILGGIWADQSWGRFWGWDPKENGALLIVLWNALILHARWGGLVRERGLAVMSVFGNVVCSLSWFGVNMLGVGLHSYGFMDQALGALLTFIASQLAIMALGVLPQKYWRGIQAREKRRPAGHAEALLVR
jgi:cytochrome c biogenesis factor